MKYVRACVRARACVCVRACVRACVCVCVCVIVVNVIVNAPALCGKWALLKSLVIIIIIYSHTR